MPEIPVTTNECESEQDKLLHNIWQILKTGVPLIPGIVSAQFPYGWDVNNVTNAILYNIMLLIGGGGGGGGTVTSVGSSSASLAVGSAPNPLIGAGNINFELQVIPITRAAFITAMNGGTLLPGVTYSITDPQAPLDALYVTAFAVNGINTYMSGLINGEFVVCFWNPTFDEITFIHCPRKNNTTVRWAGGPYNCIENFDTTASGLRNCYLESCDYSSDGTENIDGLTVLNDCSFEALGSPNIDSVLVEEDSDVIVEGTNLFMAKIGGRGNVTFIDSFASGLGYDMVQCYLNGTIVFDMPFHKQYYLPNLQDAQKNVPVTGGAFFIADSKSNIIAVNFNPATTIASYQVSTPTVPMDKQILLIDTTKRLLALSFISGSTATIVDAPTTLDPFMGGLKYQYDLGTNAWYAI